MVSEGLPLGHDIKSVPTKCFKEMNSLPLDWLRVKAHSHELLSLWNRIIYEYSPCSVSVEADRPVAVSGLPKVFCGLFGLPPSAYLCGLWIPSLPDNLMWYSIGPGRRSSYVFPSWSWLSTTAAITSGWSYSLSRRGYRTPLIRVLEAKTTKRTRTEFGPVSSGHIRLQAPMCQIVIGTSKPFDQENPQDNYNRIYLTVGDQALKGRESFYWYWD